MATVAADFSLLFFPTQFVTPFTPLIISTSSIPVLFFPEEL